MAYAVQETEVKPLLGWIDPDLGLSTYRTPWVSMQTTHKLECYIQVGDMGNLATFDCALLQAQDEDGAGAKAITGKAIAQLTQAGGDGNNRCAILLRTEELDVQNRFCYVQVRVRALVAASNFSVLLLGAVPRFAAVDTSNWTEIVP